MQAVILAAGQSSRFSPFNLSHKSSLTLLGKPIITHTILAIKKAGITDILLVVSPKSIIKELVGSGEELGVSITYIEQPEPKGAGNALLIAQEYLHDTFFLLNASHIDADIFLEDMKKKNDANTTVVLLGQKTNNPASYGILHTKEDIVLDIVEKPELGKEPSDIRVVGIYLFKKEFIETLKDTPDEHYQLESALGRETKKGTVKWLKTEEEIITLKYAWDLFNIKNYLLSKLPHFISPKATIAPNAEIIGNVCIEEGVKVLEGACIKGPVYIGKNALIGNNAIVRNNCVIEEDVLVGSMMEIKNTILMKGATTHTGFIGDSIIGAQVKIAAGVNTANVRIDRGEIISVIKDQKVNTHLLSFGVVIGEKTKTGINVSTMPGVIIGNNAIIGPCTCVMKNVSSQTKYYTKQTDIIEEHIVHE